jgi:hypothetical protein
VVELGVGSVVCGVLIDNTARDHLP